MTINFAQVRAIVFDLGNVLIDVDVEKTVNHWSQYSSYTAAEIRTRLDGDPSHSRFERGEIEFAEFATYLRGHLRLDAGDDTIKDGWNALLGSALPGAQAAIAHACRAFPSYLFSNSNAVHAAVWSETERALLAPLNELYVSHTIGMRKPEAGAYFEVAKRAGFAPQSLLFFDDLAENITAARDAGYQAHRVDRPHDILAFLSQRLPS